jgi:osmotically-inducible protein OsmY
MEARMKSQPDLDKGRIADAAQLADADIAAAIADVLSWNRLPADTVWATVAGGHVTLEGEVERWSQRDAIERGVCRVKGVRGLTNLLAVRLEVIEREMEEKIVEARASPW